MAEFFPDVESFQSDEPVSKYCVLIVTNILNDLRYARPETMDVLPGSTITTPRIDASIQGGDIDRIISLRLQENLYCIQSSEHRDLCTVGNRAVYEVSRKPLETEGIDRYRVFTLQQADSLASKPVRDDDDLKWDDRWYLIINTGNYDQSSLMNAATGEAANEEEWQWFYEMLGVIRDELAIKYHHAGELDVPAAHDDTDEPPLLSEIMPYCSCLACHEDGKVCEHVPQN